MNTAITEENQLYQIWGGVCHELWAMNIPMRRSRLSGVAWATCPDKR